MSQAKQVFKLWDEGEKPYYKENDLQEHEEETWGSGHGFGLGRKEDGTDQWVPLFVNWMKLRV